MDVTPTRAIPCQGLWLLSEGHFLAQSHQCQGLWLLSEGHFLAQSHQRQGLWLLSEGHFVASYGHCFMLTNEVNLPASSGNLLTLKRHLGLLN